MVENSTMTFESQEGAVAHYYHFLFGALIPLIEYSLRTNITNYYVRTDVGPMKLMLCEMPFNLLSLDEGNNLPGPDWIKLPAYDIFSYKYYSKSDMKLQTLQRIRQPVNHFLSKNIPQYFSYIPTKQIILIQRKSDSYFKQVYNDPDGVFRRFLPNHYQLVQALSAKYGDMFINIHTERTSIYYQYHMFKSARLIIGQHGAALSNIYFLQKYSDAHLLEICPSNDCSYYRNLALFCNLTYSSVLQFNENSIVNVSIILRRVQRIVSKWHNK